METWLIVKIVLIVVLVFILRASGSNIDYFPRFLKDIVDNILKSIFG